MLTQFVSGAINGFLFGVTAELCLFLFQYIKAGGDIDSMPPIAYFIFPLEALFVVGIAKVIICRLLRICEHSIIGWQVVGMFSLIAFIIYGQIRILIVNSLYGHEWRNDIYLSELIVALLTISIFNLLYSVSANRLKNEPFETENYQ